MANEISSASGFAMDNASGTLTDIGGYVNSVSLNGGPNLLEDTGLGDTRETFVRGLNKASKIDINGFLNSTTRPIIGPLAADGTSITKTVEVKLATSDYWTGEAWPEATIDIGSGSINSFSVSLTAENGLTATSVTAVV